MQEALGPVSINIQRRIKDALDPQNILNPGKVLP
jgi:FAD/FMN-containing dehydrogenase